MSLLKRTLVESEWVGVCVRRSRCRVLTASLFCVCVCVCMCVCVCDSSLCWLVMRAARRVLRACWFRCCCSARVYLHMHTHICVFGCNYLFSFLKVAPSQPGDKRNCVRVCVCLCVGVCVCLPEGIESRVNTHVYRFPRWS